MDRTEAIKRIKDHIRVHHIGEYPHIKIGEALNLAISALETDNNVGSKWIPVTERLPDEAGIYLVVVKYKYDFEKEYTYDTDVATFHFDDSGNIDTHWATYVDWDEGQQYLHVTHWMPLPEPPKEVE